MKARSERRACAVVVSLYLVNPALALSGRHHAMSCIRHSNRVGALNARLLFVLPLVPSSSAFPTTSSANFGLMNSVMRPSVASSVFK